MARRLSIRRIHWDYKLDGNAIDETPMVTANPDNTGEMTPHKIRKQVLSELATNLASSRNMSHYLAISTDDRLLALVAESITKHIVDAEAELIALTRKESP